MKRHVTITLILFSFISLVCYGQEKPQLTSSQKVKDFEYLYETLNDNYPYFGVGKRANGIDWLSKKEEYVKLVQKTESDSAYVFTLHSILEELGSGHADMRFVKDWNYNVDLYKKAIDRDPKSEKWVATLTDPAARAPYWASLLNSRKIVQLETKNTAIKRKPRSVYSDSIIDGDKIGIMRITSFGMEYIKKDSARIMSFLNKIKDFDNLIIDIQNNGGGSSRYWKENIVGKLTKDTIHYPQYLIIKDGDLNKEFYPNYFENTTVVKKEGTLQNIPSEILDGTFRLKISTYTIFPNKPIPFKGKIYLLVNDVVFSSAEGFAYYCKATKWATIAGTRTGGDGVGSDPVPFILPESGIIIRYPALSGFNPDGSLNFEERTIPDILMDAKDADERLSNLINYIRQKE